MEFPRVDRKQWSTSDGSLGATMISLFESGNFYDCTIQVGSEGIDDGVKVSNEIIIILSNLFILLIALNIYYTCATRATFIILLYSTLINT
jgi:hypothetical protein